MTSEHGERLRRAAEARQEYMVSIRRDLHAHPEVAFEEHRTGRLLADELEKLGLAVRRGVARTGAVAVLRGGRPGKTVALRADIDALPIPEQTGLPFASRDPAASHACGHDAHAAMLLGAAGVLAEMRAEIAGNVVFICEPAEERSDAEGVFGAQLMVAEGALDDPPVDAIFAAHVFPEYPTGTIALRAGSIMAGHSRFKLSIVGREAHAGTPHLGVDAIVVAARVIEALQTLASREVEPGETFALNVGTISGGTLYNLLAGRVDLVGSTRTGNARLRAELPGRLERLARGITEAAGATFELEYDSDTYPPTENDPILAGLVRRTASALWGEDSVVWMDRPRLTGETFCYYLRRVPGVYFILGTGNEAKGTRFSSHHSRFDLDEDALPIGAATLAALALTYLRQG